MNYDVIIYVDGGFRRTKNLGAWGYLIINVKNKKAVEAAKVVSDTTNNRMELTAVIEALRVLKTPGKRILLISDSQYTINCCSKWIPQWKKRNWGKREGALKNVDLLKIIDELSSLHEINYMWVRGHDGNKGNEHVDAVLNRAMNSWLRGETGEVHNWIDQWEDQD